MPHETIHAALAEKVESAKKKKTITRVKLAAMIGKTPGSITQYLNGETALTEDVILSMCRALGLRWQDLAVEIDLPPKDPRIESLRAMLGRAEGLSDPALTIIGTALASAIEHATLLDKANIAKPAKPSKLGK